MQRDSEPARRCLAATLAGLAVWTMVLLTLASAGFGAEVVALWLIPAWLAAAILAFVLDWVPHHPHDQRGRYIDTRAVLAPGLNTLLLGHDVHIVHHLYPRVPFYRYMRLFRAIRPELEAHGTPILDLRTQSR